MSNCQYFFQGEWYSEDAFKKILNNGLLDSLIQEGKIDVPFPVDTTKVKQPIYQTIEQSGISAKVLRNVLVEEIKSSTGYPVNLITALELTADGKDFKIPLWASPYSLKFESLLTSLVSNSVIKQKFHGHSYILGSPTGFNNKTVIKEGQEAVEVLETTPGVVVSKSFNGTLLPMRLSEDGKKLLPAQVMLPFKFKGIDGKILNIKDFIKDGYLDTEKLPQSLRTLFGFRIPTQGHNSMSMLERVGF